MPRTNYRFDLKAIDLQYKDFIEYINDWIDYLQHEGEDTEKIEKVLDSEKTNKNRYITLRMAVDNHGPRNENLKKGILKYFEGCDHIAMAFYNSIDEDLHFYEFTINE